MMGGGDEGDMPSLPAAPSRKKTGKKKRWKKR
jgi:hypothetical protein